MPSDPVRAIADAHDRQDWPAVLDIGDAWLEAPTDPRAVPSVQLVVGKAAFMLGRNDDAVRLLAAAIDGDAEGDLVEAAYFAGMAAMMAGDLEHARALLRRGRAMPPGSWATDAIGRGLAQVELELGNFDDAVEAIASLPTTPDSQLLHLVIIGRIHQRAGRADEARRALRPAARALSDLPDDLPSTEAATLSGMLVSIASAYVALGHARPAADALAIAGRLLAGSGAIETPSMTYIPLFTSEVRRLDGDLDEAEQLLDATEGLPRTATDITPMLLRQHARLAWDRGDRAAAARAYEQAAQAFDAIGYRWQAQDARREAGEGPMSAAPLPDPGVPAEAFELPDALLIRFAMREDDDAGALLEVAQLLEQLITRDRAGEYDGWEAGGGEFVVYCYGDPEQLWAAVEGAVRSSSHAGIAVLRRAGNERQIPFG